MLASIKDKNMLRIRTSLSLALLLILGGLPAIARELVIDAKVNNKPARFLFDTGAETSVLFLTAAQRLGLQITEPRRDLPPPKDGRVRLGRAEKCLLSLGQATNTARFAILDAPTSLSLKHDGIVAWSDMANNILWVNAEKGQLSALKSLPKNIARWSKWNLRQGSKFLVIQAQDPNGIMHTFSIDTGSPYGIDLSSARWKCWLSENPNPSRTMRAYYTPGDGIVASEECWAREFNLGKFSIRDVPISQAAPSIELLMPQEASASLCLYALTRFDMIIDGINGRAYTRPKRHAKSFYPHNRIGAVFIPNDATGEDLIAHVAEGTPAYEAGIRNGDVLLTIDGRDMTKWRTDPSALPGPIFQRPAGTCLDLKLSRAGKEYGVILTLKDLLGVDNGK